MADSRLEIILAAKDISGKAFTSVQAKLGALTKGIFSFRGALGGVLGVGGFGALISQSLATADAIAKTADKVGLTTDALQELRHAADLSGVGTRTLDMAMQRFSRRLGEAAQGKGELVGILKQYNIAVTDATGRARQNTDVLGDLAEAIKGAGSEQERLRIAFKAFDSEGAALVNMLKNGRDGLNDFKREAQELGLVIDEKILRGAEGAQDAISKLTRVIQTRFTIAVAENADQLARMADGLIRVIEKVTELSRLRSIYGTFGEAAGYAAQGLLDWDKFVAAGFKERQAMVDSIREMMQTADDAWTGRYNRIASGGYATGGGFGGGPDKQGQALLATYKLTDAFKAQGEEVRALIRYNDELMDSVSGAAERRRDYIVKRAHMDALSDGYEDTFQALERIKAESGAGFDAIAAGAETAGQAISANLTDGLMSFIDGTKKAGEAFADFARSTLNWIAQLVAQKVFEQAFGSVFGSVAHAGGVVGKSAFPKRSVNPAMFAFAPRLHGGLAPDEFPAILQRGETVVPKGAGGGGTTIININAIDTQSIYQALRKNPAGIVTVVRENLLSGGALRSAVQRSL